MFRIRLDGSEPLAVFSEGYCIQALNLNSCQAGLFTQRGAILLVSAVCTRGRKQGRFSLCSCTAVVGAHLPLGVGRSHGAPANLIVGRQSCFRSLASITLLQLSSLRTHLAQGCPRTFFHPKEGGKALTHSSQTME